VKYLVKILLTLMLLPALAALHLVVTELPKRSISLFAHLGGLSLLSLIVFGWVFLEDKFELLDGYTKAAYFCVALISSTIIFFVTIMWMFIMGFALEGLYDNPSPPSDQFFAIIAILPIWVLAFLIALVGRIQIPSKVKQ